MNKTEITIEELKKIEETIPEKDQMYFDEAIMIMRNGTEKTEMISLAYALGYMRGKRRANNI